VQFWNILYSALLLNLCLGCSLCLESPPQLST
jgi:hypothetical protein